MAEILPETITFLDLLFQKLPSNVDLFVWNDIDYVIYYCPGVSYLLFKKCTSSTYAEDCHFLPFQDFVTRQENFKPAIELLELMEPCHRETNLTSTAGSLKSLEQQVSLKAKESGKDIYLFQTQPQGFLE